MESQPPKDDDDELTQEEEDRRQLEWDASEAEILRAETSDTEPPLPLVSDIDETIPERRDEIPPSREPDGLEASPEAPELAVADDSEFIADKQQPDSNGTPRDVRRLIHSKTVVGEARQTKALPTARQVAGQKHFKIPIETPIEKTVQRSKRALTTGIASPLRKRPPK